MRLTNERARALCTLSEEAQAVYPGVVAVLATFSDFVHPQQMRQRHIDKDTPFQWVYLRERMYVHSAALRWRTTKPLDGCFVEVAG